MSAKLLTFFLEHPIFIFGYGVSDDNIKAILSDIDEILVSQGDLVENIFIIDWQADAEELTDLSYESLVNLDNGKSIRINKIIANDFSWIYDALAIDTPLEKVNPKLLRALLSRTYELVRTDIPRRSIEIDYKTLKSALKSKSEVGKIFGITNLVNPSAFSINYPYSLTEVARMIGYNSWHGANRLLDTIKDKKGVCIKESDNKYHIAIKNGEYIAARKYSDELVQLLKTVESGNDYQIDLSGV